MHKLIILIETPDDQQAFDGSWPLFLKEAEKMPGLVREATIQIVHSLYGNSDLSMIHELYFESYDALKEAMSSPQGQISGHVLQKITGGRMSLLFADHREDDLENIKKYKIEEDDAHTS